MGQKHGQQKLDEINQKIIEDGLKPTSTVFLTQKEYLRNAIDECAATSNSFDEFQEMVQNEDLDYFGLCSSLNATPELMSFKLYSLTKRGQAYHMPMEIQSNFLAK